MTALAARRLAAAVLAGVRDTYVDRPADRPSARALLTSAADQCAHNAARYLDDWAQDDATWELNAAQEHAAAYLLLAESRARLDDRKARARGYAS